MTGTFLSRCTRTANEEDRKRRGGLKIARVACVNDDDPGHLKKFEGIFGFFNFFTFDDLVKISLNLDKNVMIMNQNCHDEPNKKSHTNTPDHHRPEQKCLQ
jgi:hypothetical protein